MSAPLSVGLRHYGKATQPSARWRLRLISEKDDFGDPTFTDLRRHLQGSQLYVIKLICISWTQTVSASPNIQITLSTGCPAAVRRQFEVLDN